MSDESKNNDSRITSLERGKYSREDDANFDRLMVFTDTRLAESLKLNEASHEFVDASLNYSDSDNQAFEQLMNMSGSAKGSRSSGDSNGNSSGANQGGPSEEGLENGEGHQKGLGVGHEHHNDVSNS